MRQAFGYVQQISGDENPIRAKLLHSLDNVVMSRVISVQMQICEMDGATTS
jgi:hypothetical protein